MVIPQHFLSSRLLQETEDVDEGGGKKKKEKETAFVIVGVSASVPPLCPDTLFRVAGAALHLSMYLSKQLGRGSLRGPRTAASSLPRVSSLKSCGSCLNALCVHAQCPNPGPALPLSRELT